MVNKCEVKTILNANAMLTQKDFYRVKEIIHDYCGIYIQEGKQALVQSRLMKRMRKLGINSFCHYLDYVENSESGAEFLAFVDVLTTNKTNFFREAQHFEFIKDTIIPRIKGRKLKWWSAGCSSGEEPVTVAITLKEARSLPQSTSIKILATDISREVLSIAQNGEYPGSRMINVPTPIQKKYFIETGPDQFSVKDEIRNMISYARINLTGEWPFKGNFQVIMCRNVMIYFNRKTQQEVVAKFYNQLAPGGYLFVGHSESVCTNNKRFKSVAPAVYQKI